MSGLLEVIYILEQIDKDLLKMAEESDVVFKRYL